MFGQKAISDNSAYILLTFGIIVISIIARHTSHVVSQNDLLFSKVLAIENNMLRVTQTSEQMEQIKFELKELANRMKDLEVELILWRDRDLDEKANIVGIIMEMKDEVCLHGAGGQEEARVWSKPMQGLGGLLELED